MAQAFADLIAGIQQITSSITEAREAAKNAAQGIAGAAESAAGSKQRFRELAEEIGDDADRLKAQLDGFGRQVATQLDDLRDQIKRYTGAWGDEIRLQIDLLELGATKIDDFLRKFGDTVVLTEDGAKKIRDLIDGLDPTQLTREIQELTDALKRGKADLEDVIAFLEKKGGKVGETVKGWLEAFQKGEITLQRLRQLIEGLERQFKGAGDLGILLDQLEDGLRKGKL